MKKQKINIILLVIDLILLCLFAKHHYDIAMEMCESSGNSTEYCLNGLK